ncbi:tetratricopeptide repeat protein [Mucilaginibacter yixingensis]|uniref:Tetratricopeptide repeat protein n=1 Tax=Mucilaginibacter yixingensis TaxID=1295612 RepID=A0A2T5J5P1_9SPHI|nr:tetratricopeptide repeat protein [Mucilaginibacter yixingensis]PTQ93564.1 tetratricopeptide repeat protein [Mucilaginibacter yixingensis]
MIDLIIGYIFFLISRFINVTLHELGHAIPAIIFTGQPAEIFIGSYGDGKQIRFRLGKITFNINPRPSFFGGGGCRHESVYGFCQNLIVLISGPLFTFLIALATVVFASCVKLDGSIEILIAIVFISSLISLFNNLWPKNKVIEISGGQGYFNDGFQLQTIIKRRKSWDQISSAIKLANDKEYEKALEIFEQFEHPKGDVFIFLFNISCYCFLEQHQKGIEYIKKTLVHIPAKLLCANDYILMGSIYAECKQYNEAIHLYTQGITSCKENANLFIGRAHCYLLIDDYQRGLDDLDQVICLDKNSAVAHNNRGHALIYLNRQEEALKAINQSLQLDNTSAYTHGNLGLYHLKYGDSKLALELLEKARAMDSKLPEIDDHIEQARQKTFSIPSKEIISEEKDDLGEFLS